MHAAQHRCNDLKLKHLTSPVRCELNLCDGISAWLTRLQDVRLPIQRTLTLARECRLSGAATALRPSSVMFLQESRLRERRAVRLVSMRSPLSLKVPPSSFSLRKCTRCLCIHSQLMQCLCTAAEIVLHFMLAIMLTLRLDMSLSGSTHYVCRCAPLGQASRHLRWLCLERREVQEGGWKVA